MASSLLVGGSDSLGLLPKLPAALYFSGFHIAAPCNPFRIYSVQWKQEGGMYLLHLT